MVSKNRVVSRFLVYLPSLLWVIAVLYSCLGFISLSMPGGIGVGLDPSWSYALSKAVAEELIFGKDIIFTFGPFGYLGHGAVLEQNFWAIIIFRFVVHFSVFAATLAKILTLKNNLFRFSLGLSILFAYSTGLSNDYQILFLFLIILSFENIWNTKPIRLWAISLGALSGFCLLGKFTSGIYTLGSLVLLLSGNIYLALKSKLDFTNNFFALIEAILASVSTAFILINPNYYIINFTRISGLFLLSLIAAITTKFCCQLLMRDKGQQRSDSKNLSLVNISFYVFYCLGLFVIAHYSFPSLTAYLKSSWEITSGYSSAMSTFGSAWELGAAISQLVLILIVLFFTAREGSFSFPISLVLVLALSFKHGFVRHDRYHMIVFFSLTPLVVALCLPKITQKSQKIFSLLVHLYTLLVLLIVLPSSDLLKNLTPTGFIHNTSTLFNFNHVKKDIKESSLANLAEAKLPDRVAKIVKDKSIDIIPWEISLVEANNLNWKPRPIFQSYSAYTSFLDRANLQSFLSQPRDYIIYQFSSIDGRHPFFDEPATLSYVFCNYKLSSQVPYLVSTTKIFNLMLLEKQSSNICFPNPNAKTSSLPWNTNYFIEASNGSLVRAAVKIQYSTLGKVFKTLFKSPPVMMQVTDVNGQESSYRIIPENSENGVIVSHLPKNDIDALLFFQGQLPIRTSSFKFSTTNPLLYKPNIEISLISDNFSDGSIQEHLNNDISKIKNIQFLNNTSQINNLGNLDTPNKNTDKPFKPEDTISVAGWAVFKSSERERTWVLLTYGSDNKPLAITTTGSPRPDLVKFYNNSKYMNSGWSIDFNSKKMPKGVYNIKAWIYDPVGKYALPLSGSDRVEIQ